jgi:hypothetical protein
MKAKSLVPLRPASRLERLAPWLLLWVAAPLPLWLALGMSWYFRR